MFFFCINMHITCPMLYIQMCKHWNLAFEPSWKGDSNKLTSSVVKNPPWWAGWVWKWGMNPSKWLLNEENDGEIEDYSMDLGLYFQRNLSLIWRNWERFLDSAFRSWSEIRRIHFDIRVFQKIEMFSQDSLDDIDTSSIPEFHIFVLSILQFHWIGLRENLWETIVFTCFYH